MTTVRTLIGNAMKLLGALQAGESPSANEAADGLAFLNMLVDSLTNQRLIIYSIDRSTYTLTANTQTYTLGSGGTWNATRPVRIESMSVLITTVSPNIELPIQMLRDEEWQAVTVKSVSSTFPLVAYDDGAFPLRSISFWPIPTDADSVVIYSYSPISQFANISASISLPPGYERFLTCALALEMAPQYGVEPSPTLLSNYTEARRTLTQMNWTADELSCDPAVLKFGGSLVGIKSRGYVIDP